MGMDGQLLTGLKIEIQNLKIRGVMNQQSFHCLIAKTAFLKHFDSFYHG
jgi:hypothetical protein